MENTNKDTEFKGGVDINKLFALEGREVQTETVQDKEEVVEQETTEPKKEDVVLEDNSQVEEIENLSKALGDTTEKNVDDKETESYKTIKTLLENGLIEDFSIQLSDNEEDVVNISDFKNMSTEQFKEIIELHKQGKEEEISNNYLSKENLKPHHIKVIEILKNGGDFSDISDTPNEAVKMPFEDFDSNDRQHSINVLFHEYMKVRGLTEEDARDLIIKKDKTGVMVEEAQNIVETYHNSFNKYLDDKLEVKKKEQQQKKEKEQDNKKTLVQKLKEAGLKENQYKKIANEYLNKDEKGDYLLVSKFREILEEPEKYHTLIAHIADPKSFEDIYRIKSSNETVKTIYKLAAGTGKSGNKQTIKANGGNSEKYESFVEMFNKKVTEQ